MAASASRKVRLAHYQRKQSRDSGEKRHKNTSITSVWKAQNRRIVLYFTYLGSNFEADGDCEQDVKIRMAIAKSVNIW